MRETFETPLSTVIQEEDIARRAFELYEARGCQNGHDLEDWLQAEQELEAQRRFLATVSRAATAKP
jgi:Protein of unknown function (DUF2934)